MISSRCAALMMRVPQHDQAAVRTSRESHVDSALDFAGIAHARPDLTRHPTKAPRLWIAASPPEPAGIRGSRMTATRFTPGAISLSSSSRLPLMLNSYGKSCGVVCPVAPGCSTKPPPTGSIVVTNTIGTVRLACCNAPRRSGAKPRRHPARARPTPQRICESDRDRLRPSGIRSARYGQRSSPVPPAPARTP